MKGSLGWSTVGAPSFLNQHHDLGWDLQLDSLERGLRRGCEATGIKAGLIVIIVREHGVDVACKVSEFFMRHRSRLLALDLAGNEDVYPCSQFEPAFRSVRGQAHITIHSGEDAGPENMWEAIEVLGAQRIGHGVACVRDPKLMEFLASNKICLEVSPTSNILTKAAPSYEAHPIHRIIEVGIPVSVNTDDPTFFETTVPEEVRRLGLSEEATQWCLESSRTHSFLT